MGLFASCQLQRRMRDTLYLRLIADQEISQHELTKRLVQNHSLNCPENEDDRIANAVNLMVNWLLCVAKPRRIYTPASATSLALTGFITIGLTRRTMRRSEPRSQIIKFLHQHGAKPQAEDIWSSDTLATNDVCPSLPSARACFLFHSRLSSLYFYSEMS